MRWLAFALVSSVGWVASPAFAQSGSNKAAAEALFSEGRSLASAGKCDEAIPKFQASQKLDPGIGTLLNLADCYEKVGRTASAWGRRAMAPESGVSRDRLWRKLQWTRAAAGIGGRACETTRGVAVAVSARGRHWRERASLAPKREALCSCSGPPN